MEKQLLFGAQVTQTATETKKKVREECALAHVPILRTKEKNSFMSLSNMQLCCLLCAMHKICPAGLLANQQAIDCVHFVQTLDKKHFSKCFSFCSSFSNKYVHISVRIRSCALTIIFQRFTTYLCFVECFYATFHHNTDHKGYQRRLILPN